MTRAAARIHRVTLATCVRGPGALLWLAILSTSAGAQQRAVVAGPVVDHVALRHVREALDRIAPDSRGVIFPASRDGRAQYILNRRTSASEPEIHAAWDDICIVQGGAGVIRYGGTLRNGTALGPGETRGGTLSGAKELIVAEGDVVRIPAGVPHQVLPLGDMPIVYLIVKVARPAADR